MISSSTFSCLKVNNSNGITLNIVEWIYNSSPTQGMDHYMFILHINFAFQYKSLSTQWQQYVNPE
jgi:hypothetical protein